MTLTIRSGRLRPVTLLLVAIWTTAALTGCGAGASPAADAAAPAADAPPKAAHAGVSLDQAQLGQVHIEEISTRAPAASIKATGTVEFNADRMAKVLPPVAGQVQTLLVNLGDTVHKDGVLFVLSGREVAAAIAEHVTSRNDLELAQKTNAMTQDLFDHQAASRIALQQSRAEVQKAAAKVKQSEEGLRVLGIQGDLDAPDLQARIQVRAPIAGTVIERNVTSGQFVGPDNQQPLVTIADLSDVWVQADIFERDLRHISVGQKADVTTAAYPDAHFRATVSLIGSTVDAQTRTAKVRFLVANPDARLKPGMFTSMSLFLPESSSGGALTVPAKAVFVENSQSFAYVQVAPREFVRRQIETVTSDSDRLRVLNGLKPGERVVSDGVLLLRQLEADSPGQE
jgi:cobalt-zinc-cadmium efflux system membrane fusion protein